MRHTPPKSVFFNKFPFVSSSFVGNIIPQGVGHVALQNSACHELSGIYLPPARVFSRFLEILCF